MATRDLAEEALAEAQPKLTGVAPYLSAGEFAEPLELCLRSLMSTGNETIASGRLTDILRRVTTFGVTLARLDLRQEAQRHTEAVDWIARAAGLGPYAALSEAERQRLLAAQLTSGKVRLDDIPTETASEDVRDVLDTFRVAARLHAESLGAYVITMASAPSDVLAVEFLQMAAGTAHPQRVVPLFETGHDLECAGAVVKDLLNIPWYRDRIQGRQEVMIGYSDSAKDAGRLSADWLLYCAQEQVVAACEAAGVHLTLFHGRGGSIGRGGGPTYLAIQSQPPGSIRGTLRATEQGEMIQAKFGLVDIAIRTLEVYTTATLEAAVAPQPAPKQEWRACMDELASHARRTYRSVVYEEPRFIPYFRTATPEPELTRISIGSRPARRAKGGGVESLRAIPWQFAWTQTRLMLPSWLGIEDALSDRNGLLREMYSEWAFFASAIDLVEMTLAKADRRIAAQYDRLVPRRAAGPRLGPQTSSCARDRRRPGGDRPQRFARRQSRAAPLDRRAKSLRRSDQPGAGGNSSPLAPAWRRSRSLRCVRRFGQRHCRGDEEHWVRVGSRESRVGVRESKSPRVQESKSRRVEESKSPVRVRSVRL